MTVRLWNSYSCNNSSSYRLVAKFSDATAAEAVAAELREFFPVHAHEIDERGDYSEEPSEAQRVLGRKHGITWIDSLYWGDGGLVGDEPDVFVHDNVLIVQHTYCSSLELTGLVRGLGATSVNEEDRRQVKVSLLFRAAPGVNPELDAELTELFAGLADPDEEITTPWSTEPESRGDAAWFRDTGTVGIHLSVDPRELAALKQWLADRSLDKVSLEIDERGDLATFQAIANARCTACHGTLEYLDPRLHDIETPQLVCKPCGGLYELSTFLTKS